MYIVLIVIAVLILLIILIWIAAFFYLSDFSVPLIDSNQFKRILVVFPHADDETLVASGLMRKAALRGAKVTWVILTKGERGNPTAVYDQELKKIRVKEAQRIADLLQVTDLIQYDFGDGEVINKKTEIKKLLTNIFQKEKPDLVITYDLSGWYGHPDHIATGEIVTDLVKKIFTSTHLWYVTLPKKVWAITASLPIHMAKSPEWMKHRTFPNKRVLAGFNVIQTVQSMYLYKSQYQSFRSAIPFSPIPMWFFVSMGLFEYFYQEQ